MKRCELAATVVVGALVCIVSSASAQAPRPQPKGQPQQPGSGQVQPIGVQHLGVLGPVTGSQNTFGTLQITVRAPASGITVTLTSSQPAIASVPALVRVAPGTNDQSFQVTTFPVAVPTNVTISAQVGTDMKSATLTVVPPTVSLVACKPTNLSSGAPSTCTVWLTGTVASSSGPSARPGPGRPEPMGLAVGLGSSNSAVATVPATVIVGAGHHKADFLATTKPLPQSAAVTISASYGGLTKSTSLTVQPVTLSYARCHADGVFHPATEQGQPECELVGGNWSPTGSPWAVQGLVGLTAVSPPGGIKVKLSSSGGKIGIYVPNDSGGSTARPLPREVVIPEGRDRGIFDIYVWPVPTDIKIIVSVTSSVTGETRTTSFKVLAPTVVGVLFGLPSPPTISNVPLYGEKVPVYVRLNGPAPDGGRSIDVQYSGTTDIKGPAQVKVHESERSAAFEVTVAPCAVNPPCKVQVSAGGIAATLTVNP